MKILKSIFIVFGALLMALAAFGSAAADGTINWGGQGSENLPCTSGGLWVVQAPGATTVTAWVNGTSYLMEQQGNGAWQAESGPLPVGTTAYATYTGDVTGNTGMELSHCVEGPTPTPTQPVPTDTPTNTPPPPTETPTNTPAPTDTNTPVFTPTSTNTPVFTPTGTNTPVFTPTSTNTTVPTATSTKTPGPSPTVTNTTVPTSTNTPGPSPTATAIPTEKNTAGGTMPGNPNFLLIGLGILSMLVGVFLPSVKK